MKETELTILDNSSGGSFSELNTESGKWCFRNSINKVKLLDIIIPTCNTTGNSSNSSHLITDNCLEYQSEISEIGNCCIRTYQKKPLKASITRPQTSQAVESLLIIENNDINCQSVIAYNDKQSLVTITKGEFSTLTIHINSYNSEKEPTVYKDDLEESLRNAIIAAGEITGQLHKAGLTICGFNSGNIGIYNLDGKAVLVGIQNIERMTCGDINTIYDRAHLEAVAPLAAEIKEKCGNGGLEIFLESYFQCITGEQLKQDYYNLVHTQCAIWQGQYYKAKDQLAISDGNMTKEISLAGNFRARVFLKADMEYKFSPSYNTVFTIDQWRQCLEPIINSQRLFSSKELTLSIAGKKIEVLIEGGPENEIAEKWESGFAIINRNIECPCPLALVKYKRQAVIITEKPGHGDDITYKNILIVKPSALGDIARAIPVLLALRKKYPRSKISWLIRPEFADLVKYNPALNDIILFDKKRFTKRSFSTFSTIADYAGALRGKHFDLVLDMQGLFRSGLITGMTKAATRIGYKNARELAWLFYNKKVATPAINHSNDDCWRVGLAAGIEDSQPDFGVVVNKTAYDSALAKLEEESIKSGESYIAILPGGTADAKIWQPENYGKLADIIYKKYNVRSILLGAGKRESQIGDIIFKTANGKSVINLINKTTLSEMAALLGYSKLIIGNDSGPLHVGAAIPKTLIGIYGPTNPKAVGPVSQMENVIEAGKDIDRKGRYSKNPAHDINNISVEEVISKVDELLNRKNEI